VTTVIVGTSPLLLLRAREAAIGGDAVTVMADPAGIGGCWSTVSIDGFDHVETACHLLEADPHAYDQLAAGGARLEPMLPVPQVGIRRLRVRYGSSLLAVIGLVLLPASLARTICRDLRLPRAQRVGVLRSTARAARRALLLVAQWWRAVRSRHHVLYFVGGAFGAVDGIMRAVEDAGGTFDARRVIGVDLSADRRPVVRTDDGDIEVDHVVLSAGFDGVITFDGAAIDLEADVVVHHHVLLVIPAASVQPVSYVHFPYDTRVIRVTDVTSSATPLEGAVPRQLLLVNLRPDYGATEPSAEDIVAVLVRQRIASKAFVVQEEHRFEATSRDATAGLERLRARGARGFEPVFSYGDLTKTVSLDTVLGAGQQPSR
jgi:hypothetical protein